MANRAVHVEGLRELQRAFARADKTARDDLRDALQEAAAPVRSDAQRKAKTEISGMSPRSPWSGMRIGSSRSVVYIAPIERGVRGGGPRARREFADILLIPMVEALSENRAHVMGRLEDMLDEVIRVWEHT